MSLVVPYADNIWHPFLLLFALKKKLNSTPCTLTNTKNKKVKTNTNCAWRQKIFTTFCPQISICAAVSKPVFFLSTDNCCSSFTEGTIERWCAYMCGKKYEIIASSFHVSHSMCRISLKRGWQSTWDLLTKCLFADKYLLA